jgi:hypothetical protein
VYENIPKLIEQLWFDTYLKFETRDGQQEFSIQKP